MNKNKNIALIKYINRKNNTVQIEKTPGCKQMCFLYQHKLGNFLLDSIFNKDVVQRLIGLFMDSSYSKNLIASFIKDNNINMNESLKKLNQFNSFNDFFTRKLNKLSRTINNNQDLIISPADGKILVFENLYKSSSFYIKGVKLDLPKLLNHNQALCKEFENGSMAIIRLAPADYHRFHCPLDGYLKKTVSLPGKYYSVSPIALRLKKKIFEQNHRNLTLIQNPNLGNMLMIEVGATFVGTIKQTYKSNTNLKKGDEKGYFKFGGSTVILIFKKDTVVFDNDLLINSQNGFETSVLMGEQIAVFNKQ